MSDDDVYVIAVPSTPRKVTVYGYWDKYAQAKDKVPVYGGYVTRISETTARHLNLWRQA